MTKSTITRERLEEIRDCCWMDDLGLSMYELSELASMALAAMDSEPVAYTDERNLGYIDRGRETAYLWGKQNSEASDVALYRHAQPAVDSEFIPKNLDKALGVLGMAIPESREEFNFQTERWIQRLIDRVIRYADEFQEQPASVVPQDVLEALQKVARIRLDLNDFDGDRRGIADCLGDAEEALIEVVNRRATMLQASPVCTCPSGDGSLRWPFPVHPGNSPAIPDSARDALEKALAAMEFMDDTLNNLDAVCTEDVELVAPAFDAVRNVLAAATQEGK